MDRGMIYIYLATSCIAFVELFIALNIQREAVSLLSQSRDAMKVVMSSDLHDDEKEVLVRRASIEMFKSTFLFLGKFLAIVAVLFGIYWATIAAFPDLRTPIHDSFVSPIVLVALTLLATVYVWARNVILR